MLYLPAWPLLGTGYQGMRLGSPKKGAAITCVALNGDGMTYQGVGAPRKGAAITYVALIGDGISKDATR